MTAARTRRARPPRALVTDIDGTLTDGRRRLDARSVAALRQLVDGGWLVILATGNVLPIALALHRSIGLNGPIIAENGGIILERVDSDPRVTRLAHRSVALTALQRIENAGLPVRRLFTDRWRETEIGLEATVSVAQLRRAIGDLPVSVESTGFAVHLIEQGHGKLSALVRVLRPYGLRPGDCVIAGDGDNDVEILGAAGVAISFPSASPAARRAADFVTKHDSASGFVEALMALGVYDPSDHQRRA